MLTQWQCCLVCCATTGGLAFICSKMPVVLDRCFMTNLEGTVGEEGPVSPDRADNGYCSHQPAQEDSTASLSSRNDIANLLLFMVSGSHTSFLSETPPWKSMGLYKDVTIPKKTNEHNQALLVPSNQSIQR